MVWWGGESGRCASLLGGRVWGMRTGRCARGGAHGDRSLRRRSQREPAPIPSHQEPRQDHPHHLARAPSAALAPLDERVLTTGKCATPGALHLTIALTTLRFLPTQEHTKS